jgi:hypothetical protein
LRVAHVAQWQSVGILPEATTGLPNSRRKLNSKSATLNAQGLYGLCTVSKPEIRKSKAES